MAVQAKENERRNKYNKAGADGNEREKVRVGVASNEGDERLVLLLIISTRRMKLNRKAVLMTTELKQIKGNKRLENQSKRRGEVDRKPNVIC